jgi:N-acetylglutamate synthase-like GNAT family acetyltransferase
MREATIHDADAIQSLLHELGYPAGPGQVAERLSRLLPDPASSVFVIEDDGGIVGLAAIHVIPLIERDAPVCRLTAIVVSERARRRGTGRLLVKRVEEEARRRGCDRVEVTSSHDREGAHAFYRELGFEDRARRFVKDMGP